MISERILVEIVSILAILSGVIIVIGISRKWRIFMSPPDHIWIFPLGPYVFVKDTKYERFIPTYNMILGITMIVVGILFILIAIFRYSR